MKTLDLKLGMAHLRAELQRRTQLNPRYSMRSFARALDVSHSLLSLVMSGKRSPSRTLLLKLSDLLGVKEQFFYVGPDDSSFAAKSEQMFLIDFELIANWYYLAILSLLETADAQFNPDWMAARLGISKTEASLAMGQLKDLEIIAEVEGRWKQVRPPIAMENTRSTAFTRRFQKNQLQKAIESLENDPMEIRDMSSVTFAMDPEHIDYAVRRIRNFRRELMNELENMGEAKEVYSLAVQMIPLTKSKSITRSKK
jgi:transcriptional regulator with XRE-family HTH domain